MMVRLYPYSSKYNLIFQKEQQRLRKLLGKLCIIEHFGSTSIPGTSGKGVIDIIIGFDSRKRLQEAIKVLQSNGYFLSKIPPTKRNDRIFLSSTGDKESMEGDVHLHLTLKEGHAFKEAILFRDYLKQHKTMKDKYVKLKQQLARQIADRPLYTRLKNDLIQKVIRRAANKLPRSKSSVKRALRG